MPPPTPGRCGQDHLGVLAAAAGIPEDRAGQLLAMVGLQPAARQRTGGYSLGMRQPRACPPASSAWLPWPADSGR